MPLDRLLEEIQSRSALALEAEQARTAAERDRIARDRDERIRRLSEEIGRRSQTELTRERVQRLAAAKLEGRKRIFEAREFRTQRAMDRAKAVLVDYTVDPHYTSTLESMFALAKRELGGEPRVQGRAEDASVLRQLAGSSFVPGSLPIIGGLVAETPDGSRRLNLSFDELLRLRQDRLLALRRA